MGKNSVVVLGEASAVIGSGDYNVITDFQLNSRGISLNNYNLAFLTK